MPSYHRVSSAEQAEDGASSHSASSSSSEAAALSRRRTWSERIQDKALALAWVLLALLVAYVSNFWTVITLQQQPPSQQDELAHSYSTASRPVMQLAAICIGITILQASYLRFYLPYVKGLTDSSAWDFYCPRVIPSMIVLGVLSFLLLVRGTWPVWGFLAPFVVGLQIMGAIFATQFVPWPC